MSTTKLSTNHAANNANRNKTGKDAAGVTPVASVPFEENRENSIVHVAWPIADYDNYDIVSWENDIYPIYKPIYGEKFGKENQDEINFFSDIIEKNAHGRVVDLAIGGGTELYNINKQLTERNVKIESLEGNELDMNHLNQAKSLFDKHNMNLTLHLGKWEELDQADPPYQPEYYDLAFLVGNSISYVGRETRPLTMQAISQCLQNFNRIIKKGGHLFIDHRNFDFILDHLQGLPIQKRRQLFQFEKNVYYHGTDKIDHFPGYVTDNLVVFHYYNHEKKQFSTLMYFPIRQKEMAQLLEMNGFEVEKIYYDFEPYEHVHEPPPKSRFIQFLAKKV